MCGVGSPASRDGRRGAEQHRRVRTLLVCAHGATEFRLQSYQPDVTGGGHLGHFLYRGVKSFSRDGQSCTQFECNVQPVIGLGSCHLPLRAERIWIGQHIVFYTLALPCEKFLHLSKEHANEGAYLDQS